MFKEIETELMSIISQESIEKIAHMPSKEIAKTLDLIFNIDFKDIEKVYSETISNNIVRTVVIYHNKSGKNKIGQDVLPVSGKIHHITLIPYDLANINDATAITICRTVIEYTSIRVGLILDNEYTVSKNIAKNTLDLILLQTIPVIACAVMRKLFNGPSLSQLIHMSLCESMNTYKTMSSEEGINTLLNLFDEGLGVDELLDNGFICAIPVNDERYPGIWGLKKDESDSDNHEEKEPGE